MTPASIKVMIVDDTVTYRTILTSVLKDIPDVTVSETASNGKIALSKLSNHQIDLVLLDIEMPEMDGLETLKAIRQDYPDTGVVMVSGMNRHSADITIKALEAGALDFIPKPDHNSIASNMEALRQHLIPIFKSFSTKHSLRRQDNRSPLQALPATPRKHVFSGQIDIIVIGISTGGPNALMELVPALPGDLGVPVLIVQHMPPVFTASLASSLDKKSQLNVKEAEAGDIVSPNTVYIAPGGKHMVVLKENRQGGVRIGLNDDPPEISCRPSVNVLFRSVAAAYGKNILAIVMTGMGSDGALGVKALKRENACYCITQSADSCVVYGMPKVVDDMGLSDEQVPLATLAERISTLVKNKKSKINI